MLKRIYLTLYCCGLFTATYAQQEWQHITSVPDSRRFDDVHFLNDQQGWAVGTTTTDRKVYQTTDGGTNWSVIRTWQTNQIGYLRSIRFFNDSIAVMGTLGGRFLRTADGGQSWDTIQQLLSPRPTAICGMYRLNDSVLYAVGDFAVGAKAYRTRDRGLSWTYLGDIPQALNLIDVYFMDEDHGFLTGRANPADSGAVLLYTQDGGLSWTVKAQSGRAADLGWKIFFSEDKQTGYVTVQAQHVPEHYFFKTTDGGQNWVKKTIPIGGDSVWFIQGMAFTPAGVGWAGGHFNIGFLRSYDGGENWSLVQSNATGFNRFWLKSDNSLWVAGKQLFKLNTDSLPIPLKGPIVQQQPQHHLKVRPNPVGDQFQVVAEFGVRSLYHLYVIDQQGRRYRKLAAGAAEPGEVVTEVNSGDWPAGTYFVIMETDASSNSVKVIKF